MSRRTVALFREFPILPRVTRAFPHHYLLYAARGCLRLSIGERSWLLPPQRAAWIAAEVLVTVESERPFTACSVLFDVETMPRPTVPFRVFLLTPVVREMLLYSMRWGDDDPQDEVADSFFRVLAILCNELSDGADDQWLPRLSSEELLRVEKEVLRQLKSPWTLTLAAKVAALSERTLARRFWAEAGMSWGEYLRRARLLHAMELLVRSRVKMADIAARCGFASQSAFTHAFHRFAGQSPGRWRELALSEIARVRDALPRRPSQP